jgi:hypothetical protein
MNVSKIKMAKVFAITGLLLLVSMAARAQETHTHDWSWNTHERFTYNPEGEKYFANEFSIDLFGSYKRGHNKFNDFFDQPEHGVFGGGIGVNYFFTKMLGIGADTSMHDDGGKFIDNVAGNLILRFPIGTSCFAPYILGGAGYDFDPTSQWEAHAGVGVEFRLNPHTGIFTDGRYVWPDKTGDYSLIRAGLRFAF